MWGLVDVVGLREGEHLNNVLCDASQYPARALRVIVAIGYATDAGVFAAG